MVSSKALKLALFLFLLFGLLASGPVSAQDSECAQCHTDADRLIALVGAGEAEPPMAIGHAVTRPLDSQLAWERVFVDPAFFEDENHGIMTCDECHGGDPEATDPDEAHKDMVKDPSYPAPGICADCHDKDAYEQSPHYAPMDMKKPIEARASHGKMEQLGPVMDKNCLSCHSSCGQCHISRPEPAGGGLTAFHKFSYTPDSEQNCSGCHGATTGDEYYGLTPGSKPDFHHEDGDMVCADCHGAAEMHGEANKPASCLDCHEDIYDKTAENTGTHNTHKGKASCHVCHAQTYRNCSGCHLNEADGGFTLDNQECAFKIGFNPNPSEENPDKFVLLRKVPVERDTFEDYVPNALGNFRQEPTWKPTAPHNVVRKTMQNAECNNCHGNLKLFLLRGDVNTENIKANRSVIVSPGEVPAKTN